MDQLIAEFEKALAARKSEIGKTDNLVGLGELVAKELRKQREATATLGTLLADFYAQARPGWPEPDGLLDGMTPENRHREINTGAPVGNEFGSPAWGLSVNVVHDFTRVCDQTGLSSHLRKEK